MAKGSPHSGKCYGCGGRDHLKANCPLRRGAAPWDRIPVSRSPSPMGHWCPVRRRSSPRKMIPILGCSISEAALLHNERWAAVIYSYNDPSIVPSERPIMYSGDSESSSEHSEIPDSEMDFLGELRRQIIEPSHGENVVKGSPFNSKSRDDEMEKLAKDVAENKPKNRRVNWEKVKQAMNEISRREQTLESVEYREGNSEPQRRIKEESVVIPLDSKAFQVEHGGIKKDLEASKCPQKENQDVTSDKSEAIRVDGTNHISKAKEKLNQIQGDEAGVENIHIGSIEKALTLEAKAFQDQYGGLKKDSEASESPNKESQYLTSEISKSVCGDYVAEKHAAEIINECLQRRDGILGLQNKDRDLEGEVEIHVPRVAEQNDSDKERYKGQEGEVMVSIEEQMVVAERTKSTKIREREHEMEVALILSGMEGKILEIESILSITECDLPENEEEEAGGLKQILASEKSKNDALCSDESTNLCQLGGGQKTFSELLHAESPGSKEEKPISQIKEKTENTALSSILQAMDDISCSEQTLGSVEYQEGTLEPQQPIKVESSHVPQDVKACISEYVAVVSEKQKDSMKIIDDLKKEAERLKAHNSKLKSTINECVVKFGEVNLEADNLDKVLKDMVEKEENMKSEFASSLSAESIQNEVEEIEGQIEQLKHDKYRERRGLIMTATTNSRLRTELREKRADFSTSHALFKRLEEVTSAKVKKMKAIQSEQQENIQKFTKCAEEVTKKLDTAMMEHKEKLISAYRFMNDCEEELERLHECNERLSNKVLILENECKEMKEVIVPRIYYLDDALCKLELACKEGFRNVRMKLSACRDELQMEKAALCHEKQELIDDYHDLVMELCYMDTFALVLRGSIEVTAERLIRVVDESEKTIVLLEKRLNEKEEERSIVEEEKREAIRQLFLACEHYQERCNWLYENLPQITENRFKRLLQLLCIHL